VVTWKKGVGGSPASNGGGHEFRGTRWANRDEVTRDVGGGNGSLPARRRVKAGAEPKGPLNYRLTSKLRFGLGARPAPRHGRISPCQ